VTVKIFDVMPDKFYID